MSNPYEPPADATSSPPESNDLPEALEPGMVVHVRVVSVLLMVQGLLDVLASAGLIATGVFMKFGMGKEILKQSQAQQGGPPPGFMVDMLMWIYGGLGLVIGLIGALHLYAGFRNWSYQGRTLGIVSLAVGIGSVFTCYCAPTSLALFVYGLVVYSNPSVMAAFRMGEAGSSGDRIALAFSRFRYEKTFKR